MRIYLIGALKNPCIPEMAVELSACDRHEVFADWYSPGPEADSYWRQYEAERGRGFLDAINGPHARHVFDFDKKWLDWAEVAVMALPAGRSAHLELGYMVGRGKPTAILLDNSDPDRWDVMYRFADLITSKIDTLRTWLEEMSV